MWINALKSIRDGILSVAYPAECRVCEGAIESWDDGVACATCWENPAVTSLFDRYSVCQKCGAPAGSRIGSRTPGQQFDFKTAGSPKPISETPGAGPALRSFGGPGCGLCGHWGISVARSCGSYSGALEASIVFLKSDRHICPRLVRIIEAAVLRDRERLECDFVVAVPLHPKRKKERGFNQAEPVARIASRALGKDLVSGCLQRTKQTRRHRAGMDPVERRKSVAGAFKVPAASSLEARTVLLVDDVFTSGSTIDEAARTLLSAGAGDVKAFTIARVLTGSMAGRLTGPPAR